MSGLNFDSAYSKVNRANEHRKALNREINDWVQSNPYALSRRAVQRVETQTTEWAITAGLVRRADTRRWALIFGDAVHNLRSALDHVAFSIAAWRDAEGYKSRVRDRKFPISKIAADFKSFRGDREDMLSPSVWAAIEREQPYIRHKLIQASLLYAIDKLDITDKHHALHLIVATHPNVGWSNLEVVGGEVCWFVVDASALDGIASVPEGTKIAQIGIREPRPNVNPHFDLTFRVGLPLEADDPSSEMVPDITELLDLLCREVVGIIERVAGSVT